MTEQPAGEHHTGTLNLTGEGNAPASPISDETVEAAAKTVFLAKYGVKWDHVWFDKTRQELARQGARGFARVALEAAYPAIRQQVAEEIAVAIEGCVTDLDQWPGEFYQDAAAKAREIGARV